MIGVDTPESVHADESRRNTKEFNTLQKKAKKAKKGFWKDGYYAAFPRK